MSFDPLVTIVLFTYFTLVLTILIIWFILTMGSINSWSLPKIKHSARKQISSHLPRTINPAKERAKRTESLTGGYRYRRRHSSLQNSRVFSRKVPQYNSDTSKEASTNSKKRSVSHKKQIDTRLIDTGKNLANPFDSSQENFDNDYFRGESAKKKQRSSTDVNSVESSFDEFTKRKK